MQAHCTEEHIVPRLDTDIRLNTYATGIFMSINSHQGMKKAIKKGLVLVNGKAESSAYWVKEGDKIELIAETEGLAKPYNMSLEVVYEDAYFAAINKPAGLVVSGNQFKTLVNALPNNLKPSSASDAFARPRAVHRLDSSTSGLVLVSKSRSAHIALSQQFENRIVKKRYRAVLSGLIDKDGIVDKDIEAKKSVSRYKLIDSAHSIKNEYVSLVDLYPETGRTHQLRIHMASKGNPIMGDKLYGEPGNTINNKGLFLAAVELSFHHPVNGEKISIEIPEPLKFRKLLEREQKMWDKQKQGSSDKPS